MSSSTSPRIGLVVEQTLGHRTHTTNLRSVLADVEGITPVWLPVEEAVTGVGRHLPLYRSNWTVRSGWRARRAVSAARRVQPLDALFVHTQVPAVGMSRWFESLPAVVSLDATPIQYDELGLSYGHQRGSRLAETAKWQLNRRCFDRAATIVAWSHWAADGLVDGYGVDRSRIEVIPPGVRTAEWAAPPRPVDDTIVRLLFVGGDFHRKGGEVLLSALRRLQAELPASGPRVVLDVVTQTDIEGGPDVIVHRGLGANSHDLRQLYHRADVFCLPTFGDCLPLVLAEAGASGLPLVATPVGAVTELVRHGETGLVVDPGDADGLAATLRGLVDDPSRRRRLGAQAGALVARDHDAVRNGHRLAEVLRAVGGAVAPPSPVRPGLDRRTVSSEAGR